MFIFFPALPVCVAMLKNIPIPSGNKTPIWLPKEKQRPFIPLFQRLMPQMKPLNFRILENIEEIQIIVVQSGHPFTIGQNTIVFPLAYLRLPRDTQNKILIHELVHLHQRRDPAIYETYYRQLNFKKFNSTVVLPAEIKTRLMYNPDGPRYEWIWRNRYIPLGIEHKTYLFDIRTEHLKPVEQIVEYANAFGTSRQLYHPNEIVAHQITDAI